MRILLSSTLIVAAAAVVPSGTQAASVDLRRDDAALIHQIKATDYVFTKVLGKCSNERLTRRKGGRFVYTSTCKIAPAPEDDCQSYKVTAVGTVDSEAWATVRDVRLELECSA